MRLDLTLRNLTVLYGGNVTYMKFRLSGMIAWALFAAAVICPSKAGAQNPPPSPIFDLVTTSQHTGVLSSYVDFTASFVANNSSEYVSFAFRETPAYFAFDQPSVTLMGSSTNLLSNTEFEGSLVGQNCNHDNSLGCPPGWGAWIQAVDVSAIGQIANSPSNCDPNGAHSGTNFWCDGSVQGYDAIYQHLSGLLVGHTYNVSFWLGDNSGAAPTESDPSDEIDMLVYAGDALPVGTIPIGPTVPEPASFALLGIGIVGVALAKKKLLNRLQ